MLNRRTTWIFILALCVGSRLLTTIFYIEDVDSLRFALGVIDFDVTKLQPHFPAYPVFVFLAKFLYATIGSYALSFTLLGGLSTYVIIFFTLKIVEADIHTLFGISSVLVMFFNPLIWLMGNRFMPDITGLAFCFAVLYLANSKSDKIIYLGFFLSGLSLGVRLSYFPLLLPVLVMGVLRHRKPIRLCIVFMIGVGLWLGPLVYLTGWNNLVAAASVQTAGHFNEFGGTISTEPNLIERLSGFCKSVWADGFGLYWVNRHLLTAVTSVFLFVLLYTSRQELLRNAIGSQVFGLIFVSVSIYLGWILLFQNVIHKSRHVLPLLPFFSLIVAYVVSHSLAARKVILSFAVLVFLFCYGFVTCYLVFQHSEPTAIAQVRNYLAKKEDVLHVVSAPLIKYYLAAGDLQASFTSIETSAELNAVDPSKHSGCFVSVGSPIPDSNYSTARTFYHNPFVNRMWPVISIYEYGCD